MINKSIENAQVKVESYHFDMRKHLVEYDDVVNTHRDVIYGERNKVLSGADLKANIHEMLGEQLSEIVHSTLDGRPIEWDIDAFLAEVGTILPPPPELMDYDRLTRMGLDQIEDTLLAHAETLYGQVEEAMGRETMAEIESRLMLQAIDTNWVQHLTAMENLRQGIGLYAYGQRDPLVMYKKQGMEQFQNLQRKIQSDIAHMVFRVPFTFGQPTNGRAQSGLPRGKAAPKQPSRETAVSRVGSAGRRSDVPAAVGKKVGRNQQCPCGSGKKYKRCHGG